jgi:GT2 family glycosyltransferase
VNVADASVIVALNPHESDFRAILDAYGRQTGVEGYFELIVVDNGSRPGVEQRCVEQARSGLPVRWMESRTAGRAAANNVGARASTAKLLIFVADDFVPGPTLVRAHIEFHRHLIGPAVGIGPVLFTSDCRADPFRRWLEDSGQLFGVPFLTAALNWPREFFYVGNASLSRDLWTRLGGFDEAFEHDLFDDLEFGMRLQAQHVPTHLLPKALAWHDHPVTLGERTQAMYRSGVAARRHEQRRPGPRPWAAIAELPLEVLERRVKEGRRAGVMNLEQRSDYFRALMDLAFVRGYHGLDAAADAFA